MFSLASFLMIAQSLTHADDSAKVIVVSHGQTRKKSLGDDRGLLRHWILAKPCCGRHRDHARNL
jgi:hypothetical protein